MYDPRDPTRFVPIQTPDGIRWADRKNPLTPPTRNPAANLLADALFENRAPARVIHGKKSVLHRVLRPWEIVAAVIIFFVGIQWL